MARMFNGFSNQKQKAEAYQRKETVNMTKFALLARR